MDIRRIQPNSIAPCIAASLFLTGAIGTTSAVEDVEGIGPSSRRTALVLSEIMYRPAPRSDGRNLEYVELYNSQPWFQDISGFRIKGDIEFTFPANTVIEANAYVVIASAPADLQQVCQITNVAGGYSGRLPGETGKLRLEHRTGAVLLEVHYQDEAPWPVGASGTGHSIVLSRPSFGERDPRAWERSALIGGSPGGPEPATGQPGVVINELRSPGAETGFVELFNRSPAALDLSGWILTDDFSQTRFRVPEGTVLDPGAYLFYQEREMGFAMSPAGGSVYLVNAGRSRVIDAVQYGPQAPARTRGRHPNGTGAFRTLESATPGAANSWLHIESVVINEIMYDPISRDDRDEYIELYNWTSTNVDLSAWVLSGGISHAFPANTILKAGNYLVVAKDTARLYANYSCVSSSQIHGPFAGTLANGGERVALSRPGAFAGQMIVVDEARYGVGGRWGRWSHGGGSSLELVHPLTDHQVAESWADSDESAKAPWTRIEWTGVLTNYGTAVGTPNRVNVILMGAGECLLDNIEVVKDDGLNVVSNGTFEAGLSGWTGQGNHSRVELAGSGEGNALKLVSTGRGDPGPNRLRGRLTSALTPGKTATLRAHARWLGGDRELLVRIPGNYLEAYGQLALPPNLGTPGLPNSRLVAVPPPAIHQARHTPVLPAPNQAILISAQVSDSLPPGDITAWYRIDPETNYTAVALHDSGTAGDAVAGDGIYSGEIPGQSTGKLVAFYVTATSSKPEAATVVFPTGAPARECLARVGESATTNQFGTYRLWLTKATADRWARREVTSNDPLDATFIYGDSRAVYGAGAYFAGSKYNPNYDSPTGRPCDYAMVFPEDDPVLGTTDFRISWPGNLNSGTDATLQAEQTCFKIVEELGVPFNHRRHLNFLVNGVRRNALLEDAQRPSGEFIEEWFPDDPDGELYKIQVHYEPASDAATQFASVRRAGLESVRMADGANKASYYRWNWPKRAAKGSANDYEELFRLVDTANLAETNGYAGKMNALVDVTEWMRILAAEHFVGNWDSFGYSDGSNMYFYKPVGRKWRLCIWDMDLGLDQFSDPPTTDIFATRNGFGNLQADPVTRRFFSHPQFRRAYLRALDQIVNVIAPGLPALVNAKQAAFVRNGVQAANPSTILAYLKSRSTSVAGQLRRYDVPFAAATNLVWTAEESVTLTGTATYRAAALRLNGSECAATWTTATNWAIPFRLSTTTNRVSLSAHDENGVALSEQPVAITVIHTGTGSLAEEAPLVINEWMAANTKTVADPADGNFEDWFEIYNPGPDAVDLTGYCATDDLNNPGKFLFPAGISIPARGHLLVWADEEASQYAATGQVHVNFKLSREGETLALFGPSGRLLDLVQFSIQQPDVTMGRSPDGNTSSFLALPSASPGAYNQPPPIAPRLRCVRGESGQIVVAWDSLPGQTYRVEYKTNLLQPSWTVRQSVAATSTTASVTISPEDSRCMFFRVLLQ
jgi:hypothetical protein